jgi:hypothetical protein
MKTKLFSLALLLAVVGFAQQDAQFTQYMYNTININQLMPDQELL